MSRSTTWEKRQKINAALELLASGYTANHAAQVLADQFGLSFRQAYRYLLEAQQIKDPLPMPEATLPMTVKIPEAVACKLRTYARTNNLTIGEVIRRAVLAYFASEEYHG